ncbi:MAG: aminotransferase class V-fold PLP-dependent enzyme, partial [Sporomusa sp.]
PEFMPDRLESGTPNTPGIAGLKAGVEFILNTGQDKIRAKELELTKLIVAGLSEISTIKIHGLTGITGRTAVVSFTVEGKDSGQIAHALDKNYGIACRSGLHCAPWAHQTIGSLATGTIRFSPGYYTTAAEISQAVAAVREIAREGSDKL